VCADILISPPAAAEKRGTPQEQGSFVFLCLHDRLNARVSFSLLIRSAVVCATRANVIRRAKKLVLGIAGDIEKLAGAVVCQVSLLIVNWNELLLESEL
jgi:hypothetical protein